MADTQTGDETELEEDAESDLDASRMPFVEHLRDLRTRIRNSVYALLGGFAIAYTFNQEILVWLVQPLIHVWHQKQVATPEIGDPSLYFGSLIDPFWAYFSLSLWAGIFVASPFIFHQVWKFIAPGLYKRERRIGVVFAIVSGLCFVGGALFCYYLVLEPVYEFLLGYATANVGQIQHDLGLAYKTNVHVGLHPLLTIQDYIGFARKLLIGFGLIFELPLLIFFLSIIGLVTHRGMWRFNRWWIVLAFTLSALLTPPDVMSQLLMAGPLVVLYNISIVISWIVTRRREKRMAAM